MTDALATLPPAAPVVTRDQLDLIKRTVAAGASDAQLELFLYDCARRGVHPLDRLVHCTIRGGKYVPVVGIDYLRSRAHETGEMAGSDDAVFDTDARTATVTVYRLTHGVRYAYTATARYHEYVPAPGADGMWKKMPHVMLAKVAEALALRKGFPQQLGGLYVREELDQARPDFTDQATAIADTYATPQQNAIQAQPLGSPQLYTPPPPDPEPEDARDAPELHAFAPDRVARLPDGVVFITHIASTPTRNANVTRTTLSVVGNAKWPANQTTCTTINETLAATAEGAWHTEQPVALKLSKGKYGFDLAGIEYARERPVVADAPTEEAPLRAHDIPFRS